MTVTDLRHAPHLNSAAEGAGYTTAPYAEQLEWELKGLCRSGEYDPDLWSPTGRNFERKSQIAIDICYDCPVMMQCASWALSRHEEHGVWGGLSEKDRQEIWSGVPRPRRRYHRRELSRSA